MDELPKPEPTPDAGQQWSEQNRVALMRGPAYTDLLLTGF